MHKDMYKRIKSAIMTMLQKGEIISFCERCGVVTATHVSRGNPCPVCWREL